MVYDAAIGHATRKRPLARHQLFETHDIDMARAMVAEKFCDHRLTGRGDVSSFEAVHHHVRGETLSLNYMSYGAEVLIEPGELGGFYLIQMPRHGGAEVRNGNMLVASDMATASMLNPDRPTTMIWYRGCEQLLVQLDRQAVRDFAEQLIGRHLSGPLVFDACIRLEDPALAAWRARAVALFAAAEEQELFAPKGRQHLRSIEQELVERLLLSQPSNISHLIAAGAASLPLRHLRRAEEFIRAHAAAPIAISDIADAAQVSPRTLQLAFRKAHGCTPMQALRRERLMRARLDLMAAQPGETVTQIACRWGFFHFGRFASQYATAFSEMPHQTLARWSDGEPVGQGAAARPSHDTH